MQITLQQSNKAKARKSCKPRLTKFSVSYQWVNSYLASVCLALCLGSGEEDMFQGNEQDSNTGDATFNSMVMTRKKILQITVH